MTRLAPEQIDVLLRPVSKDRVQYLKNFSHLEAWDVRRWLIRIFGYGGFDIETRELAVVSERSVPNGDRFKHSVVYRAQVRLTIKAADGTPVAFYDDGACGDSVNQPSLGDAHDNASKTAMSQALKRCAVNLGDQFGLSLYNNGSIQPQVQKTLGHPSTKTPADDESMPQDEPVHGEMTNGTIDEKLDKMVAAQERLASQTPDAAPAGQPLEDLTQTAAQFTEQELYAAAGSGHDEVEDGAINKMERRAGRTPEQAERDNAYSVMMNFADDNGFGDLMAETFASTYGVEIGHGSTNQYRDALRLMRQAVAR